MTSPLPVRQVVDNHKPSSFRFRSLVVLLWTNWIFNIVSLVSIVVSLNASGSLFLFEFSPNTTLVPQKKQSVFGRRNIVLLWELGSDGNKLFLLRDFLAYLMLLGRQYSCRQFWRTSCPGRVVMVLIRAGPLYPFAHLSFKVTTSHLPFRLLLQIRQFTVSYTGCWKFRSETIEILNLSTIKKNDEGIIRLELRFFSCLNQSNLFCVQNALIVKIN